MFGVSLIEAILHLKRYKNICITNIYTVQQNLKKLIHPFINLLNYPFICKSNFSYNANCTYCSSQIEFLSCRTNCVYCNNYNNFITIKTTTPNGACSQNILVNYFRTVITVIQKSYLTHEQNCCGMMFCEHGPGARSLLCISLNCTIIIMIIIPVPSWEYIRQVIFV